jgi:putative membrane protein
MAIRTLEARQPPAEDIDQLRSGSEELQRGQAALGKGLLELRENSTRLRNGVVEFNDEAQSSVFVTSDVQASARQMADGMIQLNDGMQSAVDAQRKLSDGSTRLHEKLSVLVEGAKEQSLAISAISAKLPPDAKVDALKKGSESLATGMADLADGTARLNEGAQRMESGFKLLADTLPDMPAGLEGSAEGLSRSVAPALVVDAPVPNHGNAYAIAIIPAALWLGAGIATFLIDVRVLPRQGASLPPMAQFLSKLALPAALVAFQGIAIILTIIFVLKLSIVSLWAVSLTIMVAALTFLVFVLALTRALGDIGKALAILFLALQLSSSGGVMPVELSGGLYAELSPWLPLTWVVTSLKAGMFGAFEGQWILPLLPVAATGLMATWLASRLGQWRFVDEASIRPPVDI